MFLSIQMAMFSWTKQLLYLHKGGSQIVPIGICNRSNQGCAWLERVTTRRELKQDVVDRAGPRTWCSRDVRLMKRRKSSPPDDTATEESTPVRHSVADFRFSLRPWIVSPGRGQAQLVKVSRGLFLNVVTSGSNRRRRQPRQTFIPLEKFEQSAYRRYGRGHVGVFSHPRPEVLHQLWSRHMWFRATILPPNTWE